MKKKLDFFDYLKEIKNCYNDYISEWGYLNNNSQKIYIGSIKIENSNVWHQKEYHCDRNNIHSSHKSLPDYFLNNVEKDEGKMTLNILINHFIPKKV